MADEYPTSQPFRPPMIVDAPAMSRAIDTYAAAIRAHIEANPITHVAHPETSADRSASPSTADTGPGSSPHHAPSPPNIEGPSSL